MLNFQEALVAVLNGETVKRASWTKAPLRYESNPVTGGGNFMRGKKPVDLNVIDHSTADWQVVEGQFRVVFNGSTSQGFTTRAEAQEFADALADGFSEAEVSVKYVNDYSEAEDFTEEYEDEDDACDCEDCDCYDEEEAI